MNIIDKYFYFIAILCLIFTYLCIPSPTTAPKVKHKFYIIKTFFKFFFKILEPIVYVSVLTTPYQDPQYNLRGWGIPPRLFL